MSPQPAAKPQRATREQGGRRRARRRRRTCTAPSHVPHPAPLAEEDDPVAFDHARPCVLCGTPVLQVRAVGATLTASPLVAVGARCQGSSACLA